jgi:hypothetical protein
MAGSCHSVRTGARSTHRVQPWMWGPEVTLSRGEACLGEETPLCQASTSGPLSLDASETIFLLKLVPAFSRMFSARGRRPRRSGERRSSASLRSSPRGRLSSEPQRRHGLGRSRSSRPYSPRARGAVRSKRDPYPVDHVGAADRAGGIAGRVSVGTADTEQERQRKRPLRGFGLKSQLLVLRSHGPEGAPPSSRPRTCPRPHTPGIYPTQPTHR